MLRIQNQTDRSEIAVAEHFFQGSAQTIVSLESFVRFTRVIRSIHSSHSFDSLESSFVRFTRVKLDG